VLAPPELTWRDLGISSPPSPRRGLRRRRLGLFIAVTVSLAVASSLATMAISAASTPTTRSLFGRATPAVTTTGDGRPVELGTRFTSDVGGKVTSIRFYKGAGNNGTHLGNLWDAGGHQLASVTFANESASGWQTANLPTPVTISPGTTYVVSYYAPQGHYAADRSYFSDPRSRGPLHMPGGANGVFRYGSTSGFPSASYLSTNYWVDATVQPASSSPASANTPPAAPAGSATTASLFGSAQPATPSDSDPNSVEVGTRFSSSSGGAVTGIRFYKGTGNTGTHVGNLWDATGQKLASVTFTGESDSGWQTANLPDPVSLTPGAAYVVSYWAPDGHYAGDNNFFSSPTDNGPLHAPAGANGVYHYGTSSFPTSSWQSSNYWVDVNVSTTGADAATATAVESTTSTTTTAAPSSSTTTAAAPPAPKPAAAPGAAPAPGGFVLRDTGNTGPTGTLNDCGGGRDITANGTVIQNCVIQGDIGILADNVTIRNSRIIGAIRVGRSSRGGGDRAVSNPVVVDNEVAGSGGGSGINGVHDVNGLYQRNYLHNWENCMTMWTSTRAQLLDNFCTDPQAGPGAHLDGFEIYGVEDGITIRGNTVYQTVEPAAAPLNITPTPSITGTVTVENNLFRSANPAYVILGDDSQGNTGITAVINNNRLWPDGSSGFFSLRDSSGQSNYSGTGNTNWLTGASVPVH
jgi:Domain of unknown function (DUF4082)